MVENTELKCPVCGATTDKQGNKFTPRTLSGHIGGAHENYKGENRDPRKRRVAQRRRQKGRGPGIYPSQANQRITSMFSRSAAAKAKKARKSSTIVRAGMAQVLPYKRGAFLIVVDGIAQPFLAYQANLSVTATEEE